jgi:PEP-CTERM motif
MRLKQWMQTGAVLATLSICPVGGAWAAPLSFKVGSIEQLESYNSVAPYAAVLDQAAVVWRLGDGLQDPVLGAPPASPPTGLVGALNLMGAQVSGVGDASVTSVNASYGTRVKTTVRAAISVRTTGSEASLDQPNGAINRVSAPGGLTLTIPATPGVVNQGQLTISNWRVDNVTQTVWATVAGSHLNAAGKTVESQALDTALFSFSSTSGIQALSPAKVLQAFDSQDASVLEAEGWEVQARTARALSLVGWQELQGLKISQVAFDHMTGALGLVSTDTVYNALGAINGRVGGWGTLQVGLAMRVTEGSLHRPYVVDVLNGLPPARLVPEPSTYALMGLGLAGLAMVRKRRMA